MRKIVVAAMLALSALVLTSCSLAGSRLAQLNRGTEEQMADARTEQIISVLQNEDAEAMKALFSKKALAEAEDFYGEVERLFEFTRNNIGTWEMAGWSSSAQIRTGKKTLMLRFSIDINVENNGYAIYLIDYCTDTIDPDNEGLYMLEVFQLAEEFNLGPWQERMRPGIYLH